MNPIEITVRAFRCSDCNRFFLDIRDADRCCRCDDCGQRIGGPRVMGHPSTCPTCVERAATQKLRRLVEEIRELELARSANVPAVVMVNPFVSDATERKKARAKTKKTKNAKRH